MIIILTKKVVLNNGTCNIKLDVMDGSLWITVSLKQVVCLYNMLTHLLFGLPRNDFSELNLYRECRHINLTYK